MMYVRQRLRKVIRLLLGAAMIGVLLLGALTGWLVVRRGQVVELPRPSGRYAVGRVVYDWTDASRAELFGAGDHGKREVLVWVWYPADPPPGAAPASYLPPEWARARERDQGIGRLLFQRPDMVQSHAVADAPVATAQAAYPVLLLAPGLGPSIPDYTTLAEELASHGYVVVGVTMPYSAGVVVFPDGRVVTGTPAGNVPEDVREEVARQALDRLITVWGADLRFVMDQLAGLPAAPLGGHLDLNWLGIFGHSFGGATALEVCRLDSRCHAAADLDGYPYGEVVRTGLAKPALLLWSEQAGSCDDACLRARDDTRAIWEHLPAGSYQVTIRGARHMNYADYAVEFAPFLRVSDLLGAIDGQRGLQITANYLRAFFDRAIEGADPVLLRGAASDYPEVTFLAR